MILYSPASAGTIPDRDFGSVCNHPTRMVDNILDRSDFGGFRYPSTLGRFRSVFVERQLCWWLLRFDTHLERST